LVCASVFNARILPFATYGLETKALTKKYTNNLRIDRKKNEGSGHNRASRGA